MLSSTELTLREHRDRSLSFFLSFFFRRHSTFSALCSRLVYLHVPFLAHCLSFFAKGRSSVNYLSLPLSLMCTESFLFPRSALAASPRVSLFCATQHPWWATPAPTPPKLPLRTSSISLRQRPAVRNISLFHLLRHPLSSPAGTDEGSGRSWRWEPAHV